MIPSEETDTPAEANDLDTDVAIEADVLIDIEIVAPDLPGFADLGVQPAIVEALNRVGITAPFPIQAMTLPVALAGNDIIGQAKTGTGKTLGFGIPVLQRVCGPNEAGWDQLAAPGKPQALVVVPTRELAVQVAGDLNAAATLRSARVLTIYGGRASEPQIEALRKGIEVVVGTPGRLLDLAQQGHLNLGHARIVVLDEADEMLDLGFLPDVERLLGLTPDGRQMMLFSATMPGAVVALARRYMDQPTHIRAADPDDAGSTVKLTRQFAYRVHAMDKVEMLARILQAENRGLSMIFARTKRTVAKVADELTERGFAVAAIHGDLGQGAREQALRAFRNGKVDVLVATDVAARGIDVDDVTHVINYQCPEDEKTYLHRIGRTGRAGNKGVAVTFIDWDELPRWGLISKELDLGLPEPVETYSSSEHLREELGINAAIRGTLPRADQTRAGLRAETVEDLGETGRKPRANPVGGRSGVKSKPKPERDSTQTARTSPSSESSENSDAELLPRPRRSRERRRTRSGQPPADSVASTNSVASTEPVASTESAAPAPVLFVAPVDGQSAGAEQGIEQPARRRRHRGSRGRLSGQSSTDAG